MATLLDQAQPEATLKPPEIRLHAVVFQRGEWWIGTCLERCIPSQARTREALLADIERMIRTYIRWSEEEGSEPFASVPKAPKHAWDLYRGGLAERLEFVIRADSVSATTIELRAA